MRKRNRPSSAVASCFAGIVLSWAMLFVLIGVLSALVLNEYIGLDKAPFLLGAIQFIAVATGVYLTAMLAGVKKKKCCLLTGGIFVSLELSTALLVGDSVSGNMLVNLILGAIAVFAVLFLISKANTTSGKRRKRMYR